MKIGFSLGKCVRDIVKGVVDIDDVLVIIARTKIDDVEQLKSILFSYQYEPDYWMGLDGAKCVEVSEQLFNAGKIHQPRQHGKFFGWPVSNEFVWMDVSPLPSAKETNPMVHDAWAKYHMVLKLSTSAAKPSADDARQAIDF